MSIESTDYESNKSIEITGTINSVTKALMKLNKNVTGKEAYKDAKNAEISDNFIHYKNKTINDVQIGDHVTITDENGDGDKELVVSREKKEQNSKIPAKKEVSVRINTEETIKKSVEKTSDKLKLENFFYNSAKESFNKIFTESFFSEYQNKWEELIKKGDLAELKNTYKKNLEEWLYKKNFNSDDWFKEKHQREEQFFIKNPILKEQVGDIEIKSMIKFIKNEKPILYKLYKLGIIS